MGGGDTAKLITSNILEKTRHPEQSRRISSLLRIDQETDL